MFDILKKTILFGAGLASMTREKMEKFVDDMVKKGEISEKEGRELVDDMIARSKKARQDFEEGVGKAVSRALEKLNIPQRSEIEKIWARIEELEKSKEDKKDECSSAT
ncbi:MAG: phasin family protein [Syntrophaceae bacterium]|jgi:polyhydroxyalkanoate synthesis regulator phasin